MLASIETRTPVAIPFPEATEDLRQMHNEELRDMCAGVNIIFVVCILLCAIYKIYNTYNGGSLHNNISEKQKR
jgi:cell division protein FtsL